MMSVNRKFGVPISLVPVFLGKRGAVGTVIAGRPPHRPVRAALPHTVLIADT